MLFNLQEAIAVGRSFASVRGYHLDGNKEMRAMGLMNIIGSLTSCYVATGETTDPTSENNNNNVRVVCYIRNLFIIVV